MRTRSAAIGCLAIAVVSAQVWAVSLRDAGFDLASLQWGPLTLHYEQALEPELDELIAALQVHLDAEEPERQQVRKIAARGDLIAKRICEIVGAPLDDERASKGQALLERYLCPGVNLGKPRGEPHLFFMTEATIKDWLRKGQTLSGFRYTPATDSMHYRFDIARAAEQGTFDHVILIDHDAPVRDQAQNGLIPLLPFPRISLAIHELVEVTLLRRLRPKGPYFRWFSDGFANAITHIILREELGDEAADWFMRVHNPFRFEDLRKQVNLTYWMGLSYEIEVPLKSEQRLEMARYTFATLEAKRIVDGHGIGSVQAIVDRAIANGQPGWQDILRAVQEVTGEDIELRLKHYQRFEDREQGLRQYAEGYNAAMRENRLDDAVFYAKRIMELRRNLNLQVYASIALLLHRADYGADGDRVFAKLIKKSKSPKSRLKSRMLYVEYAVKTREPAKAYDDAESVLGSKPDFVPALAVRMDRQAHTGMLTEARRTAGRVLELRSDEADPYHRLANQMIERIDQDPAVLDSDGSWPP